MALELLLIPILLITVPCSSLYQYSINISLVNMGDDLLPDLPNTPYSYLLNQNVFPNTTYQTVVLKEVLFDGTPAKFVTYYDEDGNPCIRILTNKTLGKNQNAELFMTFIIQTGEKSFDLSSIGSLSQIPKELSEGYSLTGSWNLSRFPNQEEILSTARLLKGVNDNALYVLKNILLWFEDNMRYDAELTAPQEIWTTFSTRSGDCDDQANLFVLFCRILGIPAYTTLGPIYMPETSKVEEDNNMIFNLTNVAWHGWVMVYLPAEKGGGSWYPVDLTFFKNAYYEDGHIKSRNLIDHIDGSAFSEWNALEYLSVKRTDYISETIEARSQIISSNTTWTETHCMFLLSGGTEYSQAEEITQLNYLVPIFLILLSILLFIIMISHRSRSTRLH